MENGTTNGEKTLNKYECIKWRLQYLRHRLKLVKTTLRAACFALLKRFSRLIGLILPSLYLAKSPFFNGNFLRYHSFRSFRNRLSKTSFVRFHVAQDAPLAKKSTYSKSNSQITNKLVDEPVTVTAGRVRKIRTARRSNQIAGFLCKFIVWRKLPILNESWAFSVG